MQKPQNQRTKTKYNTIFRWRPLSIVTIIHNTCNIRNICNSSTIWYRHHRLWHQRIHLRRYTAALLPVVILDHRRTVVVIIRSAVTTTTTTTAAAATAPIVIKRISIFFICLPVCCSIVRLPTGTIMCSLLFYNYNYFCLEVTQSSTKGTLPIKRISIDTDRKKTAINTQKKSPSYVYIFVIYYSHYLYYYVCWIMFNILVRKFLKKKN